MSQTRISDLRKSGGSTLIMRWSLPRQVLVTVCVAVCVFATAARVRAQTPVHWSMKTTPAGSVKPGDALTAELTDFLSAIREKRAPKAKPLQAVSGL